MCKPYNPSKEEQSLLDAYNTAKDSAIIAFDGFPSVHLQALMGVRDHVIIHYAPSIMELIMMRSKHRMLKLFPWL